MVIVYSAANSLEAHMLKGLLEQHEIPAYVQGEHLQSGMGELPAIAGFIKVSVDNINQAEAKKIIREWESNNPADSEKNELAKAENPAKSELPIFGLIISFIAGAIFMQLYMQSPVTYEGIDFNGDKKLDMRWTYKNGLASKLEADYNLDGDIDAISKYKKGLSDTTKQDSNFDGKFDTEIKYKNETIHTQNVDTNSNGEPDLFINYQTNPLNYVTHIFNEKTKLIKKVQSFKMGKLSSAELDSNDDGKMDVKITYNFWEEEIGREPINQ